MIDFDQVWLPQIVGYAKLISSGKLEDQWRGRTGIVTSVTDPDELWTQIFEDLDADQIWADARQQTSLPEKATEAIDAFLAVLRGIEEDDAITLLQSPQWSQVGEAARRVVANDDLMQFRFR